MREVSDVGEQLVVRIDVFDVDPALADGRLGEEPSEEQSHLPPGDHIVGGEPRPGRTLGDLEIRQLIDGILDVDSETPDVLETLIGRPRKQDPGRARRPCQEEGHLPAGHLTIGLVVPRGGPVGDVVMGQAVDRLLGFVGVTVEVPESGRVESRPHAGRVGRQLVRLPVRARHRKRRKGQERTDQGHENQENAARTKSSHPGYHRYLL